MGRSRLSVDQRHRRGPFDVIGDVHGCLAELEDLFSRLAYVRDTESGWHSPTGRLPVFVGDLVDRGPSNGGTLDVVRQMVNADAALVVPGNHDLQLARHLSHGDAPLVYGLAETVAEIRDRTPAWLSEVSEFFDGLPGHVVLDDGRLVVAHTGLPTSRHLDESDDARLEAAYGPDGLSMDPHDPDKRHPWVADHTGPAVVYGHTPTLEAVWRNESLDVDTGCVFGWQLTALQWPERQLVWVPARARYAQRSRPFLPDELATAAGGSRS